MKVKQTLFVLVIAGTFSSTVIAGPRIDHQVHVGGPDATSLCVEGDNTCDKNFSLNAIAFSNGKVKGNYTDRFQGDWKGFNAKVDCVSVSDNKAWISAVIKNGEYGDEDAKGMRVATMVVDNGKNKESPFDQISFSYLVDDTFDCFTQPDLDLLDMPKGQVSIR